MPEGSDRSFGLPLGTRDRVVVKLAVSRKQQTELGTEAQTIGLMRLIAGGLGPSRQMVGHPRICQKKQWPVVMCRRCVRG